MGSGCVVEEGKPVGKMRINESTLDTRPCGMNESEVEIRPNYPHQALSSRSSENTTISSETSSIQPYKNPNKIYTGPLPNHGEK